MATVVTTNRMFTVHSLDLQTATAGEINDFLDGTDWALDTEVVTKLGMKKLLGTLHKIGERDTHSSSASIITRNDTLMKLDSYFVRALDTTLYEELYSN